MSAWHTIWFDFALGTKRNFTPGASETWIRGTEDNWLHSNSTVGKWRTILNDLGDYAMRRTSTTGNSNLLWNKSADKIANGTFQTELILYDRGSAGLLFRVSDTTSTYNGYKVVINNLANSVELLRITSGAETLVLSHTIATNLKQRYVLTVRATATRIMAWLDNVMLFDTAEATHTAAGFYGFTSTLDADFKHLLVTTLSNYCSPRIPLYGAVGVSDRVDTWLPTGPNLVTNGGFESDLTGWFSPDGATLTVSTTTVRAQTKSLRVQNSPGGAGRVFTQAANAIPISPRGTYIFEADIRTVSSTTEIFIDQLSQTASLNQLLLMGSNNTSGRWVHIRKLLTAADFDIDTELIRVIVKQPIITDTREAFIDNVSLREAVPIIVTPQTREVRSAEVTPVIVTFVPANGFGPLGGITHFALCEESIGT